jgi:hypothetical protein
MVHRSKQPIRCGNPAPAASELGLAMPTACFSSAAFAATTKGRRQVRSHLPYLRHRVAQRPHRTLTFGLPLVALPALALASIPE